MGPEPGARSTGTLNPELGTRNPPRAARIGQIGRIMPRPAAWPRRRPRKMARCPPGNPDAAPPSHFPPPSRAATIHTWPETHGAPGLWATSCSCNGWSNFSAGVCCPASPADHARKRKERMVSPDNLSPDNLRLETDVSLDIRFTDSRAMCRDARGVYARGVVVVGELTEHFCAALDTLSKRDYMRPWRDALSSVARGAPRSALITCFGDRGGSIPGEWCPLYRLSEEEVGVRNALILRSVVGTHASIRGYPAHVPKREVAGDEGNRISEWYVTVRDLVSCAERLQSEIQPW